jgi:transcriptional regulator with XRE-family HTH domain
MRIVLLLLTNIDKIIICGKIKPQIINIINMKTSTFGDILKNLRIKAGLSLREVCKLTGYDPSNWSKVERGKMFPPSDTKVLFKWTKILGLKKEKDIENFIDQAVITQGMIPNDVLSDKDIVDHLPAFFRTLRNKKPTKEEIERMIEIIKKF